MPQIIPPYIAFTMYRWDINVRMSTIIGFVGGGGIGLLLNQQINLLRYRDAGVAVLAFGFVGSIVDDARASCRARLPRKPQNARARVPRAATAVRTGNVKRLSSPNR